MDHQNDPLVPVDFPKSLFQRLTDFEPADEFDFDLFL